MEHRLTDQLAVRRNPMTARMLVLAFVVVAVLGVVGVVLSGPIFSAVTFLVYGETPRVEYVSCRMGWYDMTYWTPHYTQVPVFTPWQDPADACIGIPPCGDPPITGHGCP